jgi:hypothetical protein
MLFKSRKNVRKKLLPKWANFYHLLEKEYPVGFTDYWQGQEE